MVGRSVNSSQLAQDYSVLKSLLQSVRYYSRAPLYGPNAGQPRKNAVLLRDGWVNIYTHTCQHLHTHTHTPVNIYTHTRAHTSSKVQIPS